MSKVNGLPPLLLYPLDFSVSTDQATSTFVSEHVPNPTVIPDGLPPTILTLYKLYAHLGKYEDLRASTNEYSHGDSLAGEERTPDMERHIFLPSMFTLIIKLKSKHSAMTFGTENLCKARYFCCLGVAHWMLEQTLSNYSLVFENREVFDERLGNVVSRMAEHTLYTAGVAFGLSERIRTSDQRAYMALLSDFPIEIVYFIAQHAFLAKSVLTSCAHPSESSVEVAAKMARVGSLTLMTESMQVFGDEEERVTYEFLALRIICFAAESVVTDIDPRSTLTAFCNKSGFSESVVETAVQSECNMSSIDVDGYIVNDLTFRRNRNIVTDLVNFLLDATRINECTMAEILFQPVAEIRTDLIPLDAMDFAN